MEMALLIVGIIFAVLQIILFFKIWGMANNIKKIQEHINLNPKGIEARVAYLKGDKELAKKLLDEFFYGEAIRITTTIPNRFDMAEKYRTHENLCKYLYRKMGLEAPDFGKYRDKDNLLIN